MKTLLPGPLFILLALAACDSGTPDEAPPEASPTAPTGGRGGNLPALPDDAATGDLPATSDIPTAMQGRWGLVAADCEPGRDDAKGVMIVRPRELEFYESVGTLDKITDGADNRIRAAFDFSGEGMTWQRDLSLDLQNGGDVLVREEFGDNAAPDPLRYTRC